MIDMDTFERTMRTSLEVDAARAPSRYVPWTGPASQDRRASPRRTGQIAAIALVAASIVAAFIAVGVRHSGPSTPTAFQPSGTEFPIADLGPATRHGDRLVTLTGLSRDIGVAGAWQLTVEVLLQYQGGVSPVDVRCIEDDNSALCVPQYDEAGVSVFRTATSEGDTTQRMWAWAAVPTGTAYVSYVDGQVSLWQRPIDGVAVFPDINDGIVTDSEIAVAYSADGLELGRVDRAHVRAVQAEQETQSIKLAELEPSQQQDLEELTQGSLTACLTEAGATFAGTNATLPSDIGSQAVWEQCVATTKAIVTDRLAELGLTYRDSNG